jgi:copper chaperone CopZ
MYGDHHVTEVRRLLLEMPGVKDVYASSGFRIAEIEYDETNIDPESIQAKLEEAGYLAELPIPVERGAIEERQNGDKPFFRHSAAYEHTGSTVGFAQRVPFAGRPLWPCPGFGPINKSEEEMNYG